jgi:hypothetical protein
LKNILAVVAALNKRKILGLCMQIPNELWSFHSGNTRFLAHEASAASRRDGSAFNQGMKSKRNALCIPEIHA